jgi:cation diffusion facilitator CzcD-associated flavoprotein CzcO
MRRVADPRFPKVCIIGAGASGIAAAKALHGLDIPFDCIEASDRVGGNWVFKNKNGMSSAYRSLHINSSREKMAFADFPLPSDYPDFPHHAQVAQYFETYVDHFGFRDRILFNTSVVRAEQMSDGLWKVDLSTGEIRLYDALVVANGHHWDPRWPEPAPAGRFDGRQIHSHTYIDPYDPVSCVGRNVLVVGFGNSAMDIACELGRKGVAKTVYLSQRRGYWVLPKYLGGKPLDARSVHPAHDPPIWRALLPRSVALRLAEWRVEAMAGRPEQFGLQAPDHPILATHPAISHELYLRLGSGDIKPKPDLSELKGRQVRFVDGTIADVDVIIWCTGYRITFPFFDEGFISAPGNEIALFKRIIDPRFSNLFFIGLVQPLCALMPVAELQATFVGQYLSGQYALPPVDVMNAERVEMHERARRQHVRSPRHTIQIDCEVYAKDLRRELARGRKRAERQGSSLPVPPRVVRPSPRQASGS